MRSHFKVGTLSSREKFSGRTQVSRNFHKFMTFPPLPKEFLSVLITSAYMPMPGKKKCLTTVSAVRRKMFPAKP